MQVIEEEKQLFHKYRRALPKADREVFDELFQDARFHAAEGAYLSHLYPFEVLLLSMLLEERKRLKRLEGQQGWTL